ncbi:MAG: cell division protein FtsQ/DivIB [Halioglobus sp.]|nr:cell division protein FtsQ/DivIB [Halioglobus sp.]
MTVSYRVSTALLDRPITAITIDGPFQRVSALQIEEAMSTELERGFLSADLDDIQERLTALPWIDNANVLRRWPGQLEISVTEQVPAACWGERGLLNTRGELFVEEARHIPAELPRLSGPEGHVDEVARRYLQIRDQLIPRGLDVRRLHLDPRGAWDLTLQNGIEIRLGRRDVDARTRLFLDVVADVITRRAKEIDFVDLRYSNGFTIGWNGESRDPESAPDQSMPEMLAERKE